MDPTHQDNPVHHKSTRKPEADHSATTPTNPSTMTKVSIVLLVLVAFSSLFTSHAFDFFDVNVDLCNNSNNEDVEDLGRCDTGGFPSCDLKKEDLCYNRKPSRQHFDPITHQPVYYIQYDRVLCYPLSWGSCSSCTPGRYCSSESRCILEEVDYPCAQWY